MPKKKSDRLGLSKSNVSTSEYICEVCQNSYAGGTLVTRWEDGNNDYAYVVCPYCRHKNYWEDGQD